MNRYLIKSEKTQAPEPICPILSQINTEIFGNDSFRPYQREIIEKILENKDVFVIMPTGGMKCFKSLILLNKHVYLLRW